MEEYGVGPRALHLLCRYWEQLQMVVWAGCYYREPFNGERGVTQVGPLSPTTFNVVVDAVVFHWDSLAAEQAGGDSSNDINYVARPVGKTIW